MKRFPLILIIVALIAVALLIILYHHYSVITVDWNRTKTIFEVVQSFCTIIAIFGGAAWAYFNFFKGRTYRPRLEPKVSGKFTSKDGASYLVTTAQLKNVGLSRVKIKQEGSALQIFSYKTEAHTSKVHEVKQEYLAIFSVFEAHGWVEPGEVIEDQRLIVLPSSHMAVRLELRIVSDGIEWNVSTIVEPVPIIETQNHQMLVNGKEKKSGEQREARPSRKPR